MSRHLQVCLAQLLHQNLPRGAPKLVRAPPMLENRQASSQVSGCRQVRRQARGMQQRGKVQAKVTDEVGLEKGKAKGMAIMG